MFSKHRFVRMMFTPPLVCVLSSISASGSASAADAQAQQSTANSRAGICRLGCWLFFTVCRLALRSDVRAEPRAGTVVLEDDDVIVALVRPGAARPAGAHGAHGLAQAHAQRLRADLVGDELRARRACSSCPARRTRRCSRRPMCSRNTSCVTWPSLRRSCATERCEKKSRIF